MILLLAIIVQLLILVFVLIYLITAFTGGWYAPMPKSKINEMMSLAKVSKGDFLIDLGSGDGRLVIQAAKRGIPAWGVEINPFFFLWSYFQAKRLKLELAQFEWGNFWKKDLSKATIVTIFLPITSQKLEDKLKKELNKGSRVITYLTTFPSWKPSQITKSGIFVYEI